MLCFRWAFNVSGRTLTTEVPVKLECAVQSLESRRHLEAQQAQKEQEVRRISA